MGIHFCFLKQIRCEIKRAIISARTDMLEFVGNLKKEKTVFDFFLTLPNLFFPFFNESHSIETNLKELL